MKNKTIRRLFWDIETSPNVVLSWRVGRDLSIDHDNILKERAIICIGYKWEGSREVNCLTWDKGQCDRKMLGSFLEVANQSDEMVAHNGDKFDLTWFKTRCIFHGLPTLPDYKTIDTLQWARRAFHFNSNRLDYIAKFMGLGGKIKTEFGLWKAIVLEKDDEALSRMVRYCKRDVALLEQVFHRLRQHTKHKTHAGVIAGGAAWQCPHCASDSVFQARGVRISAGGAKRHQMQCKKCHSSYTISEAAFTAYAGDAEAKKKAA